MTLIRMSKRSPFALLQKHLLPLYARVFTRRSLVAWHRLLLGMAQRGLGLGNWEDYNISGEQWLISQFLPGRMPASAVLLDVGANQGRYSQMLLAAMPKASLHAFEPHPATRARLLEMLSRKQNARVHGCALSNNSGRAMLYDHAQMDGSEHASLSAADFRDLYGEKNPLSQHEVELSTIDLFLKEHEIPHVDFLKVDTEGHEMDVFLGASEALRNQKLGIIQFEFNLMHLARRQLVADFAAVLPNHRLFRLVPGGLIDLATLPRHDREMFMFQNIIALPAGAASL